MVYVGISRVRKGDHIRIFPLNAGSRDSLLDLRFKPQLLEWWSRISRTNSIVSSTTTSSSATTHANTTRPKATARRISQRREVEPDHNFRAASSHATHTLQELLRERGLTVVPVAHRGDCLFESFAVTVERGSVESGHISCRQKCISYLQSHREDFIDFILAPEVENSGVNVEASNRAQQMFETCRASGIEQGHCRELAYAEYLAVMSQPGQYGGQPEIEALRQVYRLVRLTVTCQFACS